MEAELSRFLVSNGIGSNFQSNNSIRSVPGGSISNETHNTPYRIGRETAEAIYRGIEK